MEMAPPVMMVPSTNMTGSLAPFAPVNVYTAPPVAQPLQPPQPAVPASSLPNAEEEMKTVIVVFSV